MEKFRVLYFESERGWGSDTWEIHYESLEEARDAYKWTNAQNIAKTAPDYYIMATNVQEFVKGKWIDINFN